MNTSIARRGTVAALAALAALALATAPAATAWGAPVQVPAGATTAEQRKTAHIQPLPASPVAYRFGETLARRQVSQEARQEIAAMEREVRHMTAEPLKAPAGERFDIEANHSQLKATAASGINSQEMQIVDFRTWLSGQTR
ncbi:hypothetical protein [Streptomyces sp. KL2]|uniref:hypothetical protein n=1 Tax=Streptomyces sp. KL2 TaxID=3050126 RepID=UPI00397D6229